MEGFCRGHPFPALNSAFPECSLNLYFATCPAQSDEENGLGRAGAHLFPQLGGQGAWARFPVEGRLRKGALSLTSRRRTLYRRRTVRLLPKDQARR